MVLLPSYVTGFSAVKPPKRNIVFDMSETSVVLDAPRESRDAARETILKAAARVIGRRGADNTRLRDIARASGLSIGALQHHFGARAELLAATFRRFNADSIRLFHQEARADDPRERLVALLELCLVPRDGLSFRDKWSVWLEFWSVSNRDRELREHSAVIYRSWREPFQQAIEDGIELGLFHPRDPVDDVVDRVIAGIDGLALRALLEPERVPPRRMAELITASLETELGTTLGAEKPAGSISQ
jgi:AcrR family transcriptional regulator